MEDFTQQKKDIISEVEKIATEKKQLQDEVNDLLGLRQTYETYIKNLAKSESKVSLLEKEKTFLEESDKCSTCKQSIAEDFRKNRSSEISDSIEKMKTANNDYGTMIDDLLNMIVEKEKNVKRIQSISAEISAKKQTMMHIVSVMNDIEDNIDKIKNADKMVIDSERDFKIAVEEIHRLENSLQFRLNERTMIETAVSLLKDGGIKTKIIKQYVPIINKLVNKYLDRMGFFVNFNIDENFNEVIKSRYRDEFAYANFSEGEKTRIDLALMFTWRSIAKMKNSVNTNLLILDEILDGSLDANGTDEFLKIIQTLTDDTNTFIISHKTDTIADKFDKTYRFEKIRNFSRLTT